MGVGGGYSVSAVCLHISMYTYTYCQKRVSDLLLQPVTASSKSTSGPGTQHGSYGRAACIFNYWTISLYQDLGF